MKASLVVGFSILISASISSAKSVGSYFSNLRTEVLTVSEGKVCVLLASERRKDHLGNPIHISVAMVTSPSLCTGKKGQKLSAAFIDDSLLEIYLPSDSLINAEDFRGANEILEQLKKDKVKDIYSVNVNALLGSMAEALE